MPRQNERTKEGLTEQQDLFARQYAVDFNGTQAAIRAGYSEKTAGAQASKLLKKVNVRAAIKRYTDKAAEKIELNAAFVLGGLMENARRCQQAEPVRDRDGEPTGVWTFDASGSNRAFELLGKHLRLFTDRLEVTMTAEVRVFLDGVCMIIAEELSTHPELMTAVADRLKRLADGD